MLTEELSWWLMMYEDGISGSQLIVSYQQRFQGANICNAGKRKSFNVHLQMRPSQAVTGSSHISIDNFWYDQKFTRRIQILWKAIDKSYLHKNTPSSIQAAWHYSRINSISIFPFQNCRWVWKFLFSTRPNVEFMILFGECISIRMQRHLNKNAKATEFRCFSIGLLPIRTKQLSFPELQPRGALL